MLPGLEYLSIAYQGPCSRLCRQAIGTETRSDKNTTGRGIVTAVKGSNKLRMGCSKSNRSEELGEDNLEAVNIEDQPCTV